MVTKSIRLSEQEAAQVSGYVKLTGETEASVLKRATLRGMKELRLEQGILAYLNGHGSAEAAATAGMGRAEFLWVLAEILATRSWDCEIEIFVSGVRGN